MESSGDIKLSNQRWTVLIAVVVYGYLNGYTNELLSLLHTLVELLDISLQEYVYIWQVFYYVIPIMGLPTAWFVDRFGIKTSLRLSLILAIIRNIFRALFFWPTLPLWKELKMFYWISLNLLMQQIVLIYYCLPLKISETWFGPRERNVAWSLVAIAPVMGASISALTLPRLVDGPDSVEPIAYINLICIPLISLVIILGVTKSKPEHFPSERAKLNEESYSNENNSSNHFSLLLKNMTNLTRDANVIIQIFAIAAFDMFILTINTILQDILAASGFTQTQTGQFMATMSMSSVILQTCSSFLVSSSTNNDDDDDKEEKPSDKTEEKEGRRRIVRKCKLYMLLICLAFLLYSLALSLRDYPEQQWWLAISGSLIYTVLRFWASPSYNDLLGYLIAGSISQATVGALQMILQALMSVLFSVAFVYLRRTDETANFNKTSTNSSSAQLIPLDDEVMLEFETKRPDYTLSIGFLAAVAIFTTLLYLFAFDGQKRELAKKTGSSNPTQTQQAPAVGAHKKLARASTLPLDLSIPAGGRVLGPMKAC